MSHHVKCKKSEKTIEQIGKALNELGSFGEGWGQQIRLEVHGQCAELPTIKAIMEIADHPNVAVCWNCNPPVSYTHLTLPTIYSV